MSDDGKSRAGRSDARSRHARSDPGKGDALMGEDGKRDDAKPRGIECPKCGCRHFHVVYTRRGPARVLRRRECRNCGRRITTCERAVT